MQPHNHSTSLDAVGKTRLAYERKLSEMQHWSVGVRSKVKFIDTGLWVVGPYVELNMRCLKQANL